MAVHDRCRRGISGRKDASKLAFPEQKQLGQGLC